MSADREPMGILPINKPEGWTSFDVVGKLRGILHIKRLGHGGTLDPMATGVLPVLVGKATKAFGIMPDKSKSYTAGFRFGIVTDTQDITGRLLSESETNISLEQIERLLPSLTGDIMQTPPMYSAVKIGGKKLYELAREGKTVEREPRQANIGRLEVTAYDSATREGTLEIDCGQGTYIRTIIHDLGEMLGAGGVMTSLTRTRSNGITLERCYSIDKVAELCSGGIPDELLLPIDKAFSMYGECRLGQRETALYKNGVRLRPDQLSLSGGSELYRVYCFDGGFLGLGCFYKNGFGSKTNFF